MNHNTEPGRRAFLRTGGAALTTSLLAGRVRGANDRIRMGFTCGCTMRFTANSLRVRLREAILVCCVLLPAMGAEYYVAPGGNDGNPGTLERPFRRIQKAADVMGPGDTCWVRQGVYRETVRPRKAGTPEKPVRFSAYPGETVVLSGTESISGEWRPYRGSIFQIDTPQKFDQLFWDGRMMIEARWPNARLDDLLDRSSWARGAAGSAHGRIVDPELAKTGVDWTGALATLNVAHQFFTWTRPVLRYEPSGTMFEYPADLPGLAGFAAHPTGTGWDDDRYYLSGKLEALDSPGEFFLDRQAGILYFWPPDGRNPAGRQVEAKARDFAFDVASLDGCELRGFHFFAATFQFKRCNRGVVDGCHLLYPAYARGLTDMEAKPAPLVRTVMTGSQNVIRNSSLAFSSTGGFEMSGAENTLENNLIHDVCWNGSLRYVGASLTTPAGSPPSMARRNTIFRTGNTGLSFQGPAIVEYNHVYDGGLACKDVSLVYTQEPEAAGSVIRYNWVHGCHTEPNVFWNNPGNGLGIRGDDQTRELTVHHNVVWDAGRDGILVKGDGNKVYNNTVFEIGEAGRTGNYISLHTMPESSKPFRKQAPLLPVQNAHSEIFNNAARTITCDQNGTPFPAGANNANNFTSEDLRLEDPGNFDFRPAADSPLIDRGRVLPGFTGGHAGKAPDIGAYEHGGVKWSAGYRNHVSVQPERPRAAQDGAGRVAIALAMPPLESVEVTIRAEEPGTLTVDSSRIRFSPSDWMNPRMVSFSLRADEGILRFELPDAEPVRVEVRRDPELRKLPASGRVGKQIRGRRGGKRAAGTTNAAWMPGLPSTPTITCGPTPGYRWIQPLKAPASPSAACGAFAI
ncbi:MAG: right-handed parallel beta-helix repeat-containing protein [Bryobacterales bacterium]|nr:right-handed parallel beta-helix repeat-containing protein [Bryobacterales bacterium]